MAVVAVTAGLRPCTLAHGQMLICVTAGSILNPISSPETAKAARLIGSWRPPDGLLAGILTVSRLGTCRIAILLSVYPDGAAFLLGT